MPEPNVETLCHGLRELGDEYVECGRPAEWLVGRDLACSECIATFLDDEAPTLITPIAMAKTVAFPEKVSDWGDAVDAVRAQLGAFWTPNPTPAHAARILCVEIEGLQNANRLAERVIEHWEPPMEAP